MKKPKNKANKPSEQPKKPIEPAVQTAEEVQDTPKTAGRFRIPKRLRAWIRESQFLATTLSIILTFGTTGLVEYCQRVKDRKMSAIMVLSTIENFSTTVDLMAQDIARCDSIGTWLLSLPQDSLDKIHPEEEVPKTPGRPPTDSEKRFCPSESTKAPLRRSPEVLRKIHPQ